MLKIHIQLLIFFAAAVACAGETSNYGIHQHYIAPRAMGMGNTFSGIDDYNVIFYNPAGLASLPQKDFNFGIGGAVSPSSLDFAKGLKDNDDDATSVSNYLQTKYGNTYSARIPRLSFIYTRPKWGIAFVPVDLSVALMPHQSGGPALDVKAYQDSTIAFGWAKKLKNNKFSWGFLIKGVYRGNIERSLLAADLVDNSEVIRDEDYKEGLTIDGDIGTQWSPFLNRTRGFFSKAKPTFALVVRNVADYGFSKNYHILNKDSVVEPEKLIRRIDVGSRWDLHPFSIFEPRVMIDVRDILHDYWSFEKGLHVGGELKYRAGKALFGTIDAGLSQMLWTAGLGLQTYFFKLELTSYAEEYGTHNAKMHDRLYLAQVNFDF